MKSVKSLPSNPFPGLRPFRSDEHHLFFGREEQTAALLQLLRTNRFLAVVGTSGSGKSSLVRAGMIAELHGGTMTQAGSTWEVMILRPGGSPVENLARAFVEGDLYDAEDASTLPRLLATLSRSRFGLVETMKQSDVFEPGTNLLVVVDQFEELFRFRQQGVDSEEAAAAFVNLLLTASQQAECPIYVTITMRSDYLGDCSEIPGLAEAVNDGEYLIPRLMRDQKRDAIEKPIGVGGAKISPLLVQRLLNDVGDDPDQLPVLQHALMRMWEAWSGGSDHTRPIDFADFEATGGLASALSNHADEIYDSLSDDRHRVACEKIFKTLTEKGADNRGIRRPTRLAHLQAIAATDRQTVSAVLEAFRCPGVTFLMPGSEVELADRTVIDLSHESLMRGWQRLRTWVEDEAQSARIFRRLLDTARLWSDGKAGLFRDPDLQIALSWREQEAPNAEWAELYGGNFDTAIVFLEASSAEAQAEEQAREAARQRELEQARQLAEVQQLRLEQQQRAAGRLRKLIAGVAVVAVIAGLACIAALVARHEASKLAEIARQNEEQARDNEEQAKQSAQRAAQSEEKTKEALAVVETQKADVQDSLSKAEAAEEAGRKLLYTTDMRLAPFVWKDDRSTAEQLRVLLAKHDPEERMKDERMKDEAGRMNEAGQEPGSSFIPRPSSVPTSDLRGFEWQYYRHLLEQSAAVFSGHAASVTGVGFAADDQMVTLDLNGQLRHWDLRSQQEDEASRRDLASGAGAQRRVLSPNGRLVALAGMDKVRVFDTATGNETFQVNSANVPVRQLIFSRDSDRLVIVDDRIRWLSAASGDSIASLDRKFDRIESLAMSTDGLTLGVAGYTQIARNLAIFRLDPTAKTVTPLAKDVAFGGSMGASAMSPDGRRIAVTHKLSGLLYLYDTTTGRALAQHGSAHASFISACAFSSDGTKLATADAEGTIKIWTDPEKLTAKSKAIVTLKGHQGSITSVGFSSDGKRLASTSADTTARVWDLENAGAAIRPLESSSNPASLVARFSPDGHLIASANYGSAVRLWDAATGRPVRELSAGDKGVIQSVAFSPTDNRLLAVGYGGQADISRVTLWDIDAGTELVRLPGATDLPDFQMDENTGAVAALAFSADGKHLVAGFGSRNLLSATGSPTPLKVWEVATRRLIRRLSGHTGYCISLDFSKDGAFLASGSRDGTAIVWSTDTWKATHTLQNPDKDSLFPQMSRLGMVEDVAFSPDGKTLAMASRERNVHFWDVATGTLQDTLKGHSSGVESVVFSPDGRTLASGSGDQTVRLWNVKTSRELMQLDPGSVDLGQVQTLAFSPDGQHLLTGGGRGTAFWSTAPLVWNDVDRAAEKLRLLLTSNADFQSRIRMLSENLRLHAALEKLDAKDLPVSAALAATQANWHASRQSWREAVAAYDRLLAADPDSPGAWLRTPGLLRLATALWHQNRPLDAAALLNGGARRRALDGIPAAEDKVALGLPFSVVGTDVVVSKLLPGSPAAKGGLRQGDVIDKVNDTDLAGESQEGFVKLLAGEAGTKVRLTVRRAGIAQPQVLELTRERFLQDSATSELVLPLRTAIDERLAQEPHDPAVLEMRAELAGQWSDSQAQLADYTAAIEVLSEQNTEGAAAARDLARLYRRRGDAYVKLQKWAEAVADYARVVTKETTDEDLLANEALAQAEMRLVPQGFTVPKPANAKSLLGATLSILPDDSILAGGENPLNDKYRIDLTVGTDISLAALRLEALTHTSLPGNGPGRLGTGNFAITSWNVTALSPDRKEPITLAFDKVKDDRPSALYPIELGHWNIAGNEGKSWNAIWSMSNPVSLAAGTTLTIEMQFKSHEGVGENLGHFRLSLLSDPAAFDRESERIAASKLTDPWQKLAAAYRLQVDLKAIDQLVDRHPQSAGLVGDLFAEGTAGMKDVSRAVALYSRAITPETKDGELLSKRARAYEALEDWYAAAADWSRAAMEKPSELTLLVEFGRRLVVAGQASLAQAQLEKLQAIYEGLLQNDPGNEVIGQELAQVLFDRAEVTGQQDWEVLTPTDATTEGGAKLARQDDGSVVLEASSPPGTELELTRWKPAARSLEALRIETSTHAVPPANGAPFLNEYQIVAAGMASPQAGALRGQYVRLDLPGDNSLFPRYPVDRDKKTINLAELQVFQGDRNIALRKKARLSSNLGNVQVAENAVDGNTSSEQPRIAHSGFENAPWWEVDLDSEQAIDRIVVWNRADVNLYARMNHFRIRVMDHSRKVVFERVIEQAPSPSTEILRPVFLAESKSKPTGESEPLLLRLPQRSLKDVPSRFRVSAATSLADLGLEEKRQEAMKIADVPSRLAAAYAMNSRNEQAVLHFGTGLERADGYEERKPILAVAARFDDVLSALVQRKPEDPQLQLAWARKLAERGRQRLSENQPAEAQVELQESHDIFLRLRDKMLWTVLTPIEWKSTGGEQFTVESDGSIFVSGPNPDRAMYTLKLKADLPTLTAIRLETIPDSRLPDGGAGRYGNGNFHLGEFTAAIDSGTENGQSIPIAFSSAIADFQTGVAEASKYSIDGKPRTYWDTYPRMQEAHWIVFELKSPARVDGRSLNIMLDTGISPWVQHNFGRFRLSATSGADALRWANLRQELQDSDLADLDVALAQAHARQGHVDDAPASFAEALSLAADRTGKIKIIAAASPFPGLLEKLAKHAASDGRFQAALAWHFTEQGQVPLADAARAKACSLFEAKLAQEPENSAWAVELADVLLPRGDNWTVMKPVEMHAESGAKLELQNDGSVFVHQQLPVKKDTYTLVFPSELKGIRGLRLETLPDPRILNGGSGWGGDANFVLNELTVHVAPAASPDQARAVALKNAAADFSQVGMNVRGLIDGVDSTGWAVSPETKKEHTAIFELAEQVGDGQASRLTFRLSHLHNDSNYVMGRFRLSVSSDPAAFERDQRRFAATKITEPWSKLAAAYHLIGNQSALERLVKSHPTAAIGVGDLFAENLDWSRAVAEYNTAVTPETKDAELFAKRAEAYEKLGQWEPAIADWGRADELGADKNKRYGNYPSLIRRALAYESLRRFDKASADYRRAVDASIGNLDSLMWRKEYWVRRGDWKQAANDYRQVWNKRDPAWWAEWWFSRERAMLSLLAGDAEGYRQAVAELLTRTEKLTDGDSSRWLVYVLAAAPDIITDANRDRLTAAADRDDAWAKPRLKAAILFRQGKFQQAADLFDQNAGGTEYEFLAAMAHAKLEHPDRARQLFQHANSWIQQQRDSDPVCGAGAPRNQYWGSWALILQLQREAARQLDGTELAGLDAGLTAEPANATLRLQRARKLAEIGLYDEALSDIQQIQPPPSDSPDFLALRGRVLAHLHLDDEALADLNQAVEAQSTDALVYAARGRILRDRGAADQALSDLEKSLKIEPSEQAARLLADLLLVDATGWTILIPTEMKSAGGATLSLQPDGSILAGGKTPERETYSLTAKTDLARIRAIRLEALPDSSLPANGPGRHANGNFHLNEFQVISGMTPALLAAPFATYDANEGLRYITDGKIDENCWSILSQTGRRQAVFFGADFTHAVADNLTFEMDFTKGTYTAVSLGRFRLSVSEDPTVLEHERKRAATIQATDPWARLAAAYAVNGRHDEALQQFSQALQRADGYEAKKPILELALQFDEVLRDLSQQQPDDLQMQLARARCLAQRGKQRLADQRRDEALADLERSREIFQRLRNLSANTKWTVLKPVEMSSDLGARLELQRDGSVFVHAKQPVTNDTYTLAVPSRMKDVLGLRLEVLADSRLPGGGPGWAAGGNFVLTELTVHAAPSSQTNPGSAIPLQNATADFYQVTSGGFDIRGTVDGNRSTAWAIYPEINKDHTAVFDLSEPLGDGQPTRLTIRLAFQSTYQDHNLGRFRLSLANDATTLQATRMRLDLKESEIAEVYVALAKAHAAQGNAGAASATLADAMILAPDRAAKSSIIQIAAPLEGVLDHLAERAAGDALFQIELARYYSEQGHAAAANGARVKARGLLERQLAAEPDNVAPAGELANLLLSEFDARMTFIAPTAEQAPVNWRYSLVQPPAGWAGPDFDDSGWTQAPGGFGGVVAAPGLFTRTAWTTPDIWLRRTFEWQPDSTLQSLLARVVHDDGFEIFLNGEQVLSRQDYAGSYILYPLDARVLSVLKPGINTLAVHCNSNFGGQHIDVGILGSSSDLPGSQRQFAAKKLTDPWSKLAAVRYLLGDQSALDKLLERHPVSAAGLGAMYSTAQDWKRAIAEFNRAITPETTDAEIYAARAETHEKLEHWELAIGDWNSADRLAIDKKQRFGNPSFPALQHRAHIHGRLQQWEQQIEAYTELLKPERFGDLTWFYSGRGEAYRRLRQFDKARADFDQAVKIGPESERAIFLNARSLFFAAQGDWNQAAENMRQVYQKVPDQNREWWRARDAALIFAMAGDEANCRQAAQECLRKASTTNLPEFDYRWSIIPLLQLPALITPENRAPLGELAAKSDAFWRPRLQAAIHFRTGEYEQAAEIFEANPPGEYFSFLAAMVYQKLGRHDRARQLLEDGRTWVREQRAKDPGTLVPNPYGWQDWITIIGPFAEAADLILGKVPGEPRKLARQGQLVEAAQVYAQALAAAPDEAAQSRIVDEMALFEGMETAAYLINNDWRNAAASYSLQIEGSTDSLAWMAAASLWAYAGDAERHRETCQKMYERCHLATEHTLKVMLLIDKGPRLPADDIKTFYVSCDNVTGPLRAWYIATRALYECRRGKNVEAHQSVEQSLAAEKEIPNSQVKGVALAVNALTYAREKDLTNARRALDELKQVMASGMSITWRADGALEGKTILKGLRPDHDQLIPEILRQEAEKLIQSTPGRR